jgi:hypothetical protein
MLIKKKSTDDNFLKVIGIIDTSMIKDLDSLIFEADGNSIRHTIDSLSLFQWLKVLNGGRSKISFSVLRNNLIILSRNLSLLKFANKRLLILHTPKTFLAQNTLKTITCKVYSVNLDIFVTRNLAKFGITAKYLDLNLDYVLSKNWDSLPIILGYVNTMSESIIAYGDLECNFTETRFTSFSLLKSKADGVKYSQIADARIIHGQVVIDKDFLYPIDTIKFPRKLAKESLPAPYWSKSTNEAMFPKSINSIGTCEEAIFLGGTNNLMHFAIEEIPKLYKLYLLNLPSDIPIILRADLSMQIREMLHILSERPLIFLKSFEEISVDRLHLFQLDNVLPLSMQGVEEVDHLLFDPISLQWASKKFRSLAPKSSGFHRIQIIREPRLFRQLINVKKISERLSTDFLFENLLTGNLSLEQAIYFFQDAKIIIGEYGAGLANLLFVSSSCKVIELKGPSNEKCREYYLLSKALGLEYFSIVGKARLLSKYGIGNGQFKINLSELLKILKYVLSKELQ